MLRKPAAVRISRRTVEADPPVKVLIVTRKNSSADVRPLLLWLHGGGYVAGVPEMDIPLLSRLLASLDICIVSVDYRLAPEHPFPAGLDDAARAYEWAVKRASELCIDPKRIAVGGTSAGGGLAASLVQRICDTELERPSVQILIYPMLDDRTACELAGEDHFVWNSRSNRFGWDSYLGSSSKDTHPPGYAVPARREDLFRLPPTWIGVGEADLFFTENLVYGQKIRDAGVKCTVTRVAGATHAFDTLNFNSPIAQSFHEKIIDVLRQELRVGQGRP